MFLLFINLQRNTRHPRPNGVLGERTSMGEGVNALTEIKIFTPGGLYHSKRDNYV